MADLLRAMSISGGILLPIVILIIIVSIATVNRGIEQMGGHHDLAPEGHGAAAHGGAVAAAAPAKKAAGEVVEEISVMQILLFGIVLFTAVMGLLLLVSVIQHS
jgi:hypothetical protein